MAALKKNSNRQSLVVLYKDFTYDQLTSGADKTVAEVPAGAVIVMGDVVMDTAFNSATSDVLDVGDAGSENRYKDDINIASAARTAIIPTGYVYTAPTAITLRWTGAGTAPSAGAGRLFLAYYVRGRADLGSQGADA